MRSEPAPRERVARASAIAGLAACVALSLAWADVLPGGWRLRERFEPHAERARRAQARHVLERLRAFEREDARAGAVVFLGASTIERFPLAEAFPGRACQGRGIAGARAAEIEALLDGLLSASMAAVVIHAGGNDRLASLTDPAPVLAAIESLVAAVRRRAPGVPVLVCGLLPSTSTRGAEASALAASNEGIAAIAERHGCEHASLAVSPLVGPDGVLVERFSTDGLHLNAEGYAHLAQRLRASGGAVAALL